MMTRHSRDGRVLFEKFGQMVAIHHNLAGEPVEGGESAWKFSRQDRLDRTAGVLEDVVVNDDKADRARGYSYFTAHLVLHTWRKCPFSRFLAPWSRYRFARREPAFNHG
jgi:hypothetical protein